MDILIILGYFFAFVAGISLGLVGSGGSILTVPILVYLIGFDAVTATGYSLFVVGATALVGGVRNSLHGNVDFKIALAFGLPSLTAAFLVRLYVIPAIPDTVLRTEPITITKSLLLLVLFAVVMLIASIKMIRPSQTAENPTGPSTVKLAASGLGTGILAGAVGAGGGFLIIPALIFLAGLPMKKAVGTSLLIIAVQSLAGFAGDIGPGTDWPFLLSFTAMAVVGIFVGIRAARFIDGGKLKTGFGYFLVAMATYILVRELFF